MIAVTFTRHHTPYNAGEIAGFPEDIAHAFVKNGVADYVNADDAPKAEQVEPAEEKQQGDGALSVEELRAELGKKNKSELVGIAKNEFSLELSTDSKKEELVEAIITAAAAESAQK